MAETAKPYPTNLGIDYPERPLNRLTTFLRILVVIPIAVVLVLISGAQGGHSDEDVFQAARKLRRILLTHDHRFTDDRKFLPEQHPSVIVLPGGAGSEDALILALYYAQVSFGRYADSWVGMKAVVTPHGEITLTSRDVESGTRTTRRYQWKKGQLFRWGAG